jgi:nucleoid DNA-binding protein
MTQPIKRPSFPGRESLARKEIVRRMQKQYLKKLGLDNKTITEIVNAFMEVYKECIVESKRVEIRNFGVINSELVRGRLITHPETKERTIAAPYYRLTFKPSAAFKKQLRTRAKKEVAQS